MFPHITMLSYTLSISRLLSGTALLCGIAALTLVGSPYKLIPISTGLVTSAGYLLHNSREQRQSYLNEQIDRLEQEKQTQIENLEEDYKSQIKIIELERDDLTVQLQMKDASLADQWQQIQQLRENDHQRLQNQQQQLQDDHQRLRDALDQERKRLTQEVEQERKELTQWVEQSQQQLKVEREALEKMREGDRRALEEQQKHIQASYDRAMEAVEQRRQQVEAELSKQQTHLDTWLKREKEALELDRQALEKNVQQVNVQLLSQQQQDAETLEQQRRAIEENLQTARQQLEDEFEQRQQELIAAVEAELGDRDHMIDYLQGQLRAAKLKLPSGKHGYPGYVARLVIECLAKYKLLVGFRDAFLRGTEELIVILEPLDAEPVKVHQIRDRLEEIQMLVGFGKPDLEVDDEVIQMTFPLVAEKLPVTVRHGAKRIEIIEPEGDWMRQIIRRSERLHAFVCGDSGSGKSTLIDNYVCLAKRELELSSNRAVEVVIIDAKDPDTPWEIDGKRITPQYGGINDPDDPDAELNYIDNDCLTGIQEMRREVYERLREAREARNHHEPAPVRSPKIYIIDEAEEIVSIHGKEASKPILTAARLGRSTGIAVIVIGQSANPQAYGFQIPNLNNFFRFYLRENARKGIQNNVGTVAERNPLLEQVVAREHRSKGLDEFHPWRFWGFIKISGEPGFIAQMPAPHTYSRVAAGDRTITVDEPPPPQSQELNILDLIEEAKQNPQAHDLNRIFEKHDQEAIAQGLTGNIKIIYDYCKLNPGKWIGTSELKQKRAAIKRIKGQQPIWDCFTRLAELGLGDYDRTAQRFRVV